MTIDQLEIYNNALLYVGERKLSGLTEERHPRYLLDDVWGRDPVKACLEEAFWTFAIRSMFMEYDSAITPEFGLQYGFIKPEDYVQTYAICYDEFFRTPVTDYADEAGAWYCNVPSLYVKEVSMGDDYGYDYSKWPQSFFEYVSCFMARRIVRILTQSKTTEDDLAMEMRKIKADAVGKDIIKKPPSFPSRGGWARARHGAGGSWTRGDRSDPYTGG